MGVLDTEDEFDLTLLDAINTKNEDQVVKLLTRLQSEWSNFYVQNKSEKCLLYSVQTGNVEITRLLLNKLHVRVNCETGDSSKSRPIHLAIMGKSTEVAKELIKYGSVVNHRDGKGKYPLDLAVEALDLDMVKLLVSQGAHVNRTLEWRSYEQGEQPIQTAIRLNAWEIFYFLLKNGANLNCVDSRGNSCVHYAVKYKQFNMLEILCKEGADLDISCPLLTALTIHNFAMAVLLLSYKASVKTKNRDAVVCHIPIMYQNDPNRHLELHQSTYKEIIRLSYSYLNETDSASGFAPLHYAAELDCVEVVQLLLEYGADINIETRKDKQTPLWLSVSPGSSPGMALFLIEYGANVHVYTNKGSLLNQLVLSASTVYFSSRYVELLKVLIEKGVRINTQDDRQLTPLERYILLSNVSYLTSGNSATQRNKAVIAELVSAGAKLQRLNLVKTGSGMGQHLSLLCRVTWYRDFETSRFLIDAGVNIENEKWIHFHGNKPDVESFLCELRELAGSPPRLLMLCRNVIRDRLSECNGGIDIRPDIEDLQLPVTLEKSLKLENEIKWYFG